MKKRFIISLIIFAAIVGGFFYFRYQVYFSHGTVRENKTFEIIKGDGNGQIATKLMQAGFISGSWYFDYYIQMHGLANKILPGKYDLNGNMTIPEIAVYITSAENILPGYAKVTIPEGWTSKQIAERLNNNGLDGQGFLKIVQDPQDMLVKYDFLKGINNLEGYLFPDTYFFKKDISASDIVQRMLDNFDKKLTPAMRSDIKAQNKSIAEVITMASIVEREVSTMNDRELVSGLFWQRIAIGQPLQSDATLTYILGDEIGQHSLAQTQIVSPYNTYRNKGLPPGPISNAGLAAIMATIYPKNSDYNYFLSDPATGQTIFSKTFEEHVANKNKYGL
jgi:UPF0755 protein